MQMFNRSAIGFKSESNNTRRSWSYAWVCSLTNDIYRSKAFYSYYALTFNSWSV